MMQRRHGLVRVGVCVAATAAAVAAVSPGGAGQGKRGRRVRPEVVAATAVQPAAAPGPSGSGFAPQTRLGFHVGDQWEPALAADGYGSVYVLYPQYEGVPGCEACASPTAILQ